MYKSVMSLIENGINGNSFDFFCLFGVVCDVEFEPWFEEEMLMKIVG